MDKIVLQALFGRTILAKITDARLAEHLANALKTMGCGCLLTGDETEALRLYQTTPKINAVIVEVGPQISLGFEILSRIRSLHEQAPPVFFIADQIDPDFDEAFFKGVEAVLIKPVTVDEVTRSVAYSLSVLATPMRRQHERRRLKSVRAVCTSQNSGAVANGYVLDVSEGGMFISAFQGLPAGGDTVDMKVVQDEAGKASQFEFTAVVKWVRPAVEFGRPPGFGIEFVNLDAKAKKALGLLIANSQG